MKILSFSLRSKWDFDNRTFELSLPEIQSFLSHVAVYEENMELLSKRPKPIPSVRLKERLDQTDGWIWHLLSVCGRNNEAEKVAYRVYNTAKDNCGLDSLDTIIAGVILLPRT